MSRFVTWAGQAADVPRGRPGAFSRQNPIRGASPEEQEPHYITNSGRTPCDRSEQLMHASSLHQPRFWPLQLDDEARFPNVRKYNEGLSARPAFKKTMSS